jgi:hypothetical protein
MRRNLLPTLGFLVAAVASGPASAWLLYPDDARPGRIIVEIERSFGETVPLKALPSPFQSIVQEAQGTDRLSFRWRYGPRAQGMAFVRVDDRGHGTITFHFAAEQFLEGERLGAALVLVDGDGTALHGFYARADLEAPGQAVDRRSAAIELSRPLDWWRQVVGLTVFFMAYHPIQDLDDDETWGAMRTAVHRITGGQGGEKRALAR